MQDDEYLASLLADKEKEIKALKEAESHYLKEDKACNKLLEEEVSVDFGVLFAKL